MVQPLQDPQVLAFGTGVPSTQAHGDSAAAGSSEYPERQGHKHAMPAAGGSAKEFFVPAVLSFGSDKPYDTVVGDFPSQLLFDTATWSFVFFVPNDFSSLSAAVVVVLPDASETVQWDVVTDFGADGESRIANSDSIVDATLAVTVDTIRELDISAALTGLAAGDYVGMLLTSNTGDIRPVGLRFRYS